MEPAIHIVYSPEITFKVQRTLGGDYSYEILNSGPKLPLKEDRYLTKLYPKIIPKKLVNDLIKSLYVGNVNVSQEPDISDKSNSQTETQTHIETSDTAIDEEFEESSTSEPSNKRIKLSYDFDHPSVSPANHNDGMVTSDLSFQDVINKQIQTRNFRGSHEYKFYTTGPNKNIHGIPKSSRQVLTVPNNIAFRPYRNLCSALSRRPITRRLRFLRGDQFKHEEDYYTLKSAIIRDLAYDPEYVLAPDPKESKHVARLSPQKDLCPYCPNPTFISSGYYFYGHHLQCTHGIFPDSYITPDPFQDPEYSGRVLCPVCAKSFRLETEHGFANNGGEGWVPFYPYLCHFARKHQMHNEEHASGVDFFRKLAFDFNAFQSSDRMDST